VVVLPLTVWMNAAEAVRAANEITAGLMDGQNL